MKVSIRLARSTIFLKRSTIVKYNKMKEKKILMVTCMPNDFECCLT